MREQTERLKKEVESFTKSMQKLNEEKSVLVSKMGDVEYEKSIADDAFYALSLWSEEAKGQMRSYKEQLADKAENVADTVEQLRREKEKAGALRVELHAVRSERDGLFDERTALAEKLEKARRKEDPPPAVSAGAGPVQTEGVQERGRPEARQQQKDQVVEEQALSSENEKAYERLAFPAQAKAFAADLKSYLKRLTALTTLPSEEARFEILASLRGFERRLEKIVDKETEQMEESQNEDPMQAVHDFQLKAGGVLVQTEHQIKALKLKQPFQLDVTGPAAVSEEKRTEDYSPPTQTAFGQAMGDPAGQTPTSAPSAAPSSSADTAGPKIAGWAASSGGWGQGWFKGSAPPASAGGNSTVSAASFEGDRAFYLALPPPWNQEPSGDRISFSDYTKLITSGYVKKFKQQLADYPRFRTDFITNFHDARIPIVAKFKALADVGGPDLDETTEGVDAGQEGYGMLIRKLELLYGGKDRQMVALTSGVKECEVVRPGKVKDMQALVDAVAKYHSSLPPERAHEARSLQHVMEVLGRLSEDMQLQYRQYCTQIGVEDEYNVSLLLRWLREVHIRHLYKRSDAQRVAPKKNASGGAAAAAAVKNKAVFYVGGQPMEVVPVQDGGTAASGGTVLSQHTAGPERCWFCQDKHRLTECPDFSSKPAATRKALVHGADLCAVCLKRGHYGAECKEERCETCGGDHHSLIHGWADGGGRGGGRGRGRGRGGRGRGRGGQTQQPGAAQDGADGTAATADNKGDAPQQPAKKKDSPGTSTSLLAAKAAATAAPVKDGEALLYGDQSQQKTFHARARFRGAPASASREEGHGGRGAEKEELPLWSSGINTYQRGGSFQFVSVANAVGKANNGDRAFNAAASSKAATGEEATRESAEEEGQISLRFSVVRVTNPETKTYTLVNALLDDGATLTSLSQRAAKVLGLKGKVEKLEVTGYGGNVSVCDAIYCDTVLSSRNQHFSKSATVAVVPDPVGKLEAVNWNNHKSRWPHLQDLPIESPLGDGQVDMILGVDQALFHQAIDEKRGRSSAEPCARLTPAGWTVVGWTHASASTSPKFVLKASSYDAVGLRGAAAPSLSRPTKEDREWLISEHLGSWMDVPDPLQPLDGAKVTVLAGPLQEKKEGVFINAGDRIAISNILQNWRQDESGRVTLPPLWKGGERPQDNYDAAFTQWQKTERSLLKQGVREEYHAAIEKWMDQGHAEWLPPGTRNGYFIPHFPVIRRDKTTTKVRVVANGRAQFNGRSLNDFMFSGPKVVNSLVQVLLRFRRYPCAVIVDVESMFLRVAMPEEDRVFHRFAYTDPTTGEERPFQTIGHVFGSTGSPCIAITALKIGACRKEDNFPVAADAVLHSSMVDDVVDSVLSPQEGAKLAQGLLEVARSLNMNLHKWCTNEPEILPAGASAVTEAKIEDKTGAAAAERWRENTSPWGSCGPPTLTR